MDEHDEPQRSGTTSTDGAARVETPDAPAAPVIRLLANPRRVRRT
ncbi:hypothetical protein [Klenkia marina]|nr:hypothetical protein [Klenkia marina]